MSDFVPEQKLKIIDAEGMASSPSFKEGDIVTFISYRESYNSNLTDIWIKESDLSWRKDRFVAYEPEVAEKTVEEEKFVYGILLKEVTDVFFSSKEEALKYVDISLPSESCVVIVKIVEADIYTK